MLNRNQRPKSRHCHTGGISADIDLVVAVGAVDDHLVVLAVPGIAADGGGEVGVDGLHVSTREVIDGDDVGAAKRDEVDPLHAGSVHGDVALEAEELEPAPVRGQVDVLGDACAVEQHRVGAGLAFDGVAAVARIPDECVVAGAQARRVVAFVPVERVVSGAPDQPLRS